MIWFQDSEASGSGEEGQYSEGTEGEEEPVDAGEDGSGEGEG